MSNIVAEGGENVLKGLFKTNMLPHPSLLMKSRRLQYPQWNVDKVIPAIKLCIKDQEDNNKICPYCGHHFRQLQRKRPALIIDEDSFSELISYPPKSPKLPKYEDKITQQQEKAKIKEAVITGIGRICGKKRLLQ